MSCFCSKRQTSSLHLVYRLAPAAWNFMQLTIILCVCTVVMVTHSAPAAWPHTIHHPYHQSNDRRKLLSLDNFQCQFTGNHTTVTCIQSMGNPNCRCGTVCYYWLGCPAIADHEQWSASNASTFYLLTAQQGMHEVSCFHCKSSWPTPRAPMFM